MGLFGKINNLKKSFDNSVIGLDIGDQSIKLSEVSMNWRNIDLLNLAIMNTPPQAIVEGKLNNIKVLSNHIKSLLKSNNFESKRVVAAVSGEQVIARNIEIPNMPKEELDEAVKWEAEDQIPLPIARVYYDYEILGKTAEGNYQILLVAVERSLVEKYLDLFKLLNLKPVAIEIESLAIARTVNKIYSTKTIGVIDIGSKTTDISILHNGQLIFTRTVGIGGENITQELVEIEHLTMAEAEEYKKTNNFFGEESSNLIIRNLTTAIYRSLDYFQVKYRDYDLDKLILTGGGGKLAGFAGHLSQEFEINVEKIDFASKLRNKTDDFNDSYLSQINDLLAVSVGLSLWESDKK